MKFGETEMTAIDRRIQEHIARLDTPTKTRYKMGRPRHPSSDLMLSVGSSHEVDLVYFAASKRESLDEWLADLQERGSTWEVGSLLRELGILAGAAITTQASANGKQGLDTTQMVRRSLIEKGLMPNNRLGILLMDLPGVVRQPCTGCVFLVGHEPTKS